MLSFAYPNGPHLSHGMIDTRIDEITTGSTEKKVTIDWYSMDWFKGKSKSWIFRYYLSDWSYISLDCLEGIMVSPIWISIGFQLDFNYIQLDLSNIYIQINI